MKEQTDKNSVAALLKRNAKLTSLLYEVNEKLTESEAFKSHFISNITNEILNPFTSILALSENIGQLGENEMEQARRMAELIHQEAFHLDFQLKNVFAVALVEAGTDNLIPVRSDLSAVMKSVIRYFEHRILGKQLEVDLKIDGDGSRANDRRFITDEQHLELIMKNLLDNAVKFSPDKGRILIRMFVGKDYLELSFRDSGKGIPKEGFSMVFDRFKQLETRIHSQNTGHGLGLSIVSAFVKQLFSGEIYLESPDEGGFEIKLRIPELVLPDDDHDFDDFLFNPEDDVF